MKIVILGGGFAGVYTGLQLDRAENVDVTLVDRNNFFLFTPMLVEIATSSIDTRHSVNPIRRLFKRVTFAEAEVTGIDFARREVLATSAAATSLRFQYDHLVIGLGSVSNYFNLPGVPEHSIGVKTLSDAVTVRNRVIERLEQADVLPADQRRELLTFVVAGGGMTGVELTGDLNDFVRDAARVYHNIREDEIRFVLLEGSPHLMYELSPTLGDFAQRKLESRGVEVYLNTPVLSATEDGVTAQGVGTIPTRNLIWAAGISPTPFVSTLGLPLQKGRIVTDEFMRVPGLENVWAAGDVARIPDGRGGFYPPTAQHALREGRHLARNIIRVRDGKPPTAFRYRTMGMLATVGRRSGVGMVMGVKVAGFPGWFLWRTYYLFRLPRLDKRVRVALDWTLDMIFPRDIVELKMRPMSDAGENAPDTFTSRRW